MQPCHVVAYLVAQQRPPANGRLVSLHPAWCLCEAAVTLSSRSEKKRKDECMPVGVIMGASGTESSPGFQLVYASGTGPVAVPDTRGQDDYGQPSCPGKSP